MAGESKAARAKMEKAVLQAFSGDLDWLDEVIQDSGYINPNTGIQQKSIIEENVTSRKILGEWESREGLDSKKVNRRKYYPLWPFIRFLFNRSNKQNQDASEYHKWQAEDKRQSALARRLKNDEKQGRLIDKQESDQQFVELILHVIASLETAFGGLAPQLAKKDVEQIRKIIDKRIDWVCQEMQQNRTPVPTKLAAEQIKKICREEIGRLG